MELLPEPAGGFVLPEKPLPKCNYRNGENDQRLAFKRLPFFEQKFFNRCKKVFFELFIKI